MVPVKCEKAIAESDLIRKLRYSSRVFLRIAMMGSIMTELQQTEPNEDRRKFLATCGKFAILVPPALTFLISTSLDSPAGARSRGRIRKSGGFRKSYGRIRRSGRFRKSSGWRGRKSW
jgi:hypothetical protein